MIKQLCPFDLTLRWYWKIWLVTAIDPRPLSSGKFAIYVKIDPTKEDELRLVAPDEISQIPGPYRQLDFVAKLKMREAARTAKRAA